jgi:two-component system sensor histidine kinase FlrB
MASVGRTEPISELQAGWRAFRAVDWPVESILRLPFPFLAPTVQRLPTAMTSLPIVLPNPEGSEITFGENEQFLREAFRSFAQTASSLERSYGLLRTEVARLHGELADSNAGLERSLEENRAMREHLDRILEGLPCGVLVTKANGEISLLNPEGRRLLEQAGGEVRSVLPGAVRELLERARSGAGEQERRFTGKDESECWLAARHAPVGNRDTAGSGRPRSENLACQTPEAKLCGEDESASIFILRDVSEAKRMVREREKLRREQALAEMSAILAHEIRNPLGSLELFAGLLAEAALEGECRQWVGHVQAGLRALGATVNNVLQFHGAPAPALVPTDLGRLLEWAEGFLLPMARQAQVELCLRNRLQGVWFSADRHRLEQVLLNLVLNALRAMPGGGWVEVAGERTNPSEIDSTGMSRRNDPVVKICVSDTGPGIHSGQEERIFEAGYSTRQGGPGLGLAVCRRIAEQHGGTLRAANRAGMGACFTLTLPFRKECSRDGCLREEEG